jgi:hypothetical protein
MIFSLDGEEKDASLYCMGEDKFERTVQGSSEMTFESGLQGVRTAIQVKTS